MTKPSGLASPYPTTNTPEAYAIDGSAAPAATQVAATSAAAYPSTENAAPITYGQAAPAPVAYPTTAAAVVGNSSSSAAVAPQAGPYATLPSSPASAPASPSSFESPGGAAFTGLAGEQPTQPVARVADNRIGGSFGDSASAGNSRYGDVNAGRGSGSMFSAGAPVDTGSGFAGAAPASPLEPPLEPARDTALQRYAPPAAQPPATSAPESTIAPPQPRRRPDPGYRPGGTSSYQPNRAILVSEPVSDPAVRTAGFDAPADPLR